MPNLDAADLQLLAERIAAGSDVIALGLSRDAAHLALRNGFGWLMIYGTVGAWTLAVVSALSFNLRRSTKLKKDT